MGKGRKKMVNRDCNKVLRLWIVTASFHLECMPMCMYTCTLNHLLFTWSGGRDLRGDNYKDRGSTHTSPPPSPSSSLPLHTPPLTTTPSSPYHHTLNPLPPHPQPLTTTPPPLTHHSSPYNHTLLPFTLLPLPPHPPPLTQHSSPYNHTLLPLPPHLPPLHTLPLPPHLFPLTTPPSSPSHSSPYHHTFLPLPIISFLAPYTWLNYYRGHARKALTFYSLDHHPLF